MEWYRSASAPRKGRRGVSGEDAKEGLKRVIEYYFVVLPGMDWAEFDGDIESRDLGITGERPWMEFEVVIKCDGLFTGFWNEGYTDLDLEFSPACFRDFKRGLVDIYEKY